MAGRINLESKPNSWIRACCYLAVVFFFVGSFLPNDTIPDAPVVIAPPTPGSETPEPFTSTSNSNQIENQTNRTPSNATNAPSINGSSQLPAKNYTHRFAILLTTNVLNAVEGVEARVKLYTRSIQRWLNFTKLPIFIVESTGYTFPNISHPRLTVTSFVLPKHIVKMGSTPAEAHSMLHVADTGLLNHCEYTFKVTGKYYLPNIETILTKVPNRTQLILQYNHRWRYQNTEVFGFLTNLTEALFNEPSNAPNPKRIPIEEIVFRYTTNYSTYRIPRVVLLETVLTGGLYNVTYL